MKKITLLFNICILLLMFQSCSITKRHYLPGYSVEWNKSKVIEKGKNNVDVSPFDFSKPSDEMPVSASIDKSKPFSNTSKKTINLKYIPFKPVEECDVLVLKNNEEIKVKVSEISQTEIKYKKCDNLDGPAYTIAKSDVVKIKFSNGTTEVINSVKSGTENPDYYSQKPTQQNHNYSGKTILNKYALASMILGILSIIFFPLFPLPIIFGIIALKQMKKSPEAYKGKGMALFGIIAGGVFLLVLLVILLSLLISFVI